MVKRGHDVTVFCRSGHFSQHRAAYEGMSLRYLPAWREKHLETLTHTALSALRLPRGAAIVCMGVGNAPVVRALELTRRRTVFNVDGADWQREKWGRLARWYLRTCERMAAHSLSIVIADAEAVGRYYEQRYGRRTELVRYGADPPEDRGTAALARWGLDAGRYLLFVGRLVPENGAHDFLEGARVAGVDAVPVVVGDATYADEYKSLLRANAPAGTVFTGYQFGSTYEQLSSHAGIFVLAATVGGTHPVLVEQMAAGNTILARETESNREVLGEAGIYWRTARQLADLLKTVWPDVAKRRALGVEARARAAERYDWEQVTDRYLELCAATLR
jgi:glycosyltransferase involved in cell wall biosynthesis